ncbi:MAG: DNA replication and repair protein RecF, partial [Chloroflexota bacterium]|nr:DNA replication and repair protein RecF [Chloroflexota bacterium]
SSLAETARAVLFRPEEMLLLVGAPSERRRFLDTILAQRERRVAHDLAELARVLAQRNALLRAIRAEEAGTAELAFWDEQLVDVGSRVLHARLRLIDDLNEMIGPLHARVASPRARMAGGAADGDGDVRLDYVDSLKRGPFGDRRPSVAELAGHFRDRLDDVRQKEIWNGMSLVGPHRDDVRALLDGRDVATHASRGQQRTIILALKLAETDVLADGASGAPIVLLDDVFSELDVHRTGRALALLVERGQVLVTTAELRHLRAEQRRGVPIWHVQDGRLSDAPLVA